MKYDSKYTEHIRKYSRVICLAFLPCYLPNPKTLIPQISENVECKSLKFEPIRSFRISGKSLCVCDIEKFKTSGWEAGQLWTNFSQAARLLRDAFIIGVRIQILIFFESPDSYFFNQSILIQIWFDIKDFHFLRCLWLNFGSI